MKNLHLKIMTYICISWPQPHPHDRYYICMNIEQQKVTQMLKAASKAKSISLFELAFYFKRDQFFDPAFFLFGITWWINSLN